MKEKNNVKPMRERKEGEIVKSIVEKSSEKISFVFFDSSPVFNFWTGIRITVRSLMYELYSCQCEKNNKPTIIS